MGTLMSHVEQLADTIGPRPATSAAESNAADYIRDVYESRGLDAEIQVFDSPRTYAWAYVLYHLLTIGAAVGSGWSLLPALLLALASAVLLRFDLDTRWGLSAIMPKRPSQNVIARHEPKVGRGERVAKVVLVAHYDSARASLAFSPGMVKSFSTTFGLMKSCTYVVPVLVLLRMFPYVDKLEPWSWYVTLVPAAYLLVPLLINVHRELFMKFTPGANDNASGVAAMLGVLERLVPEPDAATFVARETAKMRTQEEALSAGVVPEGALLSYSPVAPPSPRLESWADDDVSWDTGVISRGQTDLGFDRPHGSEPAPAPAEPARWGFRDPDAEESARLFGTGAISSRPLVADPGAASVPAPAPAHWDASDDDEPVPRRLASGMPLVELDDDLFASPPLSRQAPAEPLPRELLDSGQPMPAPRRIEEAPKRRGLFGGGGRKNKGERRGVTDWLGVGSDFDARKEGKDIGSRDNLADGDADADDAGRKGGAAAIEGIDDPDFAASEAARIRRMVTTSVDRELVEKEVWFVATGAEEVGTVGMKAFLREFGPDLRDALIVNLDNLGTGNLSYITREGMAKRYYADRRLVGAARRAAREGDLPVKGREYRGLSTDATPALARGFRAMSVMAFDINGRLPNWHWSSDTSDQVSERTLELTVDFVAALIKEL